MSPSREVCCSQCATARSASCHWPVSRPLTRHAPDFFVRRADGTGVLVDVRPDDRICAADSAVFAATAVMAGQAGWAYDRVGELPAGPAANLHWLAGYRHHRYARAEVMAALEEVFAEPGPLRAGAARVGDPLAVLPVLFAMLWRGRLSVDLDSRVLEAPRRRDPRHTAVAGPDAVLAGRPTRLMPWPLTRCRHTLPARR